MHQPTTWMMVKSFNLCIYAPTNQPTKQPTTWMMAKYASMQWLYMLYIVDRKGEVGGGGGRYISWI